MKIGIFDSGLGGLYIAKSVVKLLPQYEYIYVGDTERVPYGNRSEQVIYSFLKEAIAYLFRQDCALVIVACNTASANALHTLQREWLPRHYPHRRVLGVIIPAVEEAVLHHAKRVGVLATASTVRARAFTRELKKRDSRVRVYERAAPLLVPMIENNELQFVRETLMRYLAPLIRANIDTLILGCTHYPIVKSHIRKIVGPTVRVISQDEIVGKSLQMYLRRHKEIERSLTKKRKVHIEITDITPQLIRMSKRWFGAKAMPRIIHF